MLAFLRLFEQILFTIEIIQVQSKVNNLSRKRMQIHKTEPNSEQFRTFLFSFSILLRLNLLAK